MVRLLERLLADRRGVSTAVSYVLAIGITVVLVSGLLVGVNAMMGSQGDRAVDSELRTIGEGVAVDLTSVDRMAYEADSTDELIMRIDAPTLIAGESYRIILEETGSDAQIRVQTAERSHVVPLENRSVVEPSSVPGGTMWIVTDGDRLWLQEDRP